MLIRGTENILRNQYERYNDKRNNFNTCQRMNDIIHNQKGHRAHLHNCHDKEIIEYEDQTRKEEVDFLSPEHKRISLFHLENYSPEKKYRLSRQLKSRLIHKRPKIFGLDGQNAKKSRSNNKDDSRNKRVLHAGDPLMYHRIEGNLSEFYTDFEKQMEKKEAEAQGSPYTPFCTPVRPVKRKSAALPCVYHTGDLRPVFPLSIYSPEILKKFSCNDYVDACTKVAKHDLVNAVWVDNVQGHDFKSAQKKA